MLLCRSCADGALAASPGPDWGSVTGTRELGARSGNGACGSSLITTTRLPAFPPACGLLATSLWEAACVTSQALGWGLQNSAPAPCSGLFRVARYLLAFHLR